MALTCRYALSGKNTDSAVDGEPPVIARHRIRIRTVSAAPDDGLASVWGSVPGSGVRRTCARRGATRWTGGDVVVAVIVDNEVLPPHPATITSAAAAAAAQATWSARIDPVAIDMERTRTA